MMHMILKPQPNMLAIISDQIERVKIVCTLAAAHLNTAGQQLALSSDAHHHWRQC